MKRHLLVWASVAACLAGCATGPKYLDPRSELDRKIYYVEIDASGAPHPISNANINQRNVSRVPMPAPVDINSTITIAIAKAQLADDQARSGVLRQSDALLERKQAVIKSIDALNEVVRVRIITLQKYSENKNLDQFLAARDESDRVETRFRNELMRLWPSSNAESYAAMTQAYFADRATGNFRKLQEFLASEVAAIERSHRELETQLKARQATLSLEAFLRSPGKRPAAIHVDGYDNIKEEDLARRDPLGLNLSPEERAQLEAQVKATRELSESLERLRRGEQSLNDTLRKLAAQMAPEIRDLVTRADALVARLTTELPNRAKVTDQLLKDFISAAKARGETFASVKEAELQKMKDDFLTSLPKETKEFVQALNDWVTTGKALRADWESASPSTLTPETLLSLINKTASLARSLEGAAKALQQKAPDLEKKTSAQVEAWLAAMPAEARQALLQMPQAGDLQRNLQTYGADVREAARLVSDAYITLARLTNPVVELPPTASTSLDIPLDKIRDTFINLEETPRLVGDLITVRATYKSGDKVDTSLATFRVEKFGHYAELSPAVVLVKPQHIAGTDTGFRFAPTLSWMYHWAPRAEDDVKGASLARTLDPSIGLHSAFLNFNAPNSTTSAQIGLGLTFGIWKNRLQFGYGINLMAKSADEGRNYYFIGSDLIGLLQAIGLARPQ